MVGLSTVCVALASGGSSGDDGVERVELDNGMEVLLMPVEGVNLVGVESVYGMGFWDEPAGGVQASHLCEHLACMGGTEGFEARESYEHFGQVGMVNAETLGSLTHYDAVVPSEELETVLKVEAGRLVSLDFDADLIRFEGVRCAGEVESVMNAPMGALGKFAVMAAVQAWGSGATKISLRGGPSKMDPAVLRGLYAARYTPTGATLAIVGGFDVETVRAMLEETLGGVDKREPLARTPIDWSKVPERSEASWDVSRTVVVMAAEPLASGPEAAVVAGLMMMKGWAADDADLSKLASFGLGAPIFWGVGTRDGGGMGPMLVATLAPGADEQELIEAMHGRFDTVIDSASAMMGQTVMGVSMFANPETVPVPTEGMIEDAGKRMGWDEALATQMMIGNTALQLALRGHLAHEIGGGLDELDAGQLSEQMGELLGRAHRRVLVLRPMDVTVGQE